jgi:hypothetical protein
VISSTTLSVLSILGMLLPATNAVECCKS